MLWVYVQRHTPLVKLRIDSIEIDNRRMLLDRRCYGDTAVIPVFIDVWCDRKEDDMCIFTALS